jgi:hypothetical protein
MKQRDVKKLHLSRETVKTLDDSRLDGVAGGATRPLTLCVSCKTECTANCA